MKISASGDKGVGRGDHYKKTVQLLSFERRGKKNSIHALLYVYTVGLPYVKIHTHTRIIYNNTLSAQNRALPL